MGDAFTRRIRVTVQDALAMVIPPLGLDAPDGLAAYPNPPIVTDDGGERGEAISGHRVETVTYVARQAGAYSLPPVELAWWDVDAGVLRRDTLPELRFDVLPGEARAEFALGTEDVADPVQDTAPGRFVFAALFRRWAAPLAVVLIAGLALRRAARAGGFGLGRLKARWQARNQSEGAYFRRFRQAALSGDPRATVRTLAAWLDRRHVGPGTATFRAFSVNAADPVLDREAGALDTALFVADPTPAPWSGRRLAERIGRVRRRGPAASRRTKADDLDSLNP